MGRAKTKAAVAGTAARPAVKSKRIAAARATAPAAPRRLKGAKYRSFRLHGRIKHPGTMPNVLRLSRTSASLVWQHRRLFAGIVLVYGVLSLVFVHGLDSVVDVASWKKQLLQALGGNQVSSSLAVFGLLLGSSGGSATATAGVYQFVFLLVVSLAIIWSLRQILTGNAVRVRDGFYRGMYPLVPFVLVLVVIALQLLPFAGGAALYGVVMNNGIAVGAFEKALCVVLLVLLALLSLYMICSSLFALYIVTLPDMTPMKALRSARELVRYRRWTVLRKILWLPLVLLVLGGAIMLPIIIWLAAAAEWVFFVLTLFAVVFLHAYYYTLYRELI